MHTSFKIFLYFSVSLFGPILIAQGISMSPTRLFFSGNPGETISLPVTLSNSSENDYVFNINTKDWNRDEYGTKIYFDSGSLENSNASWISTVESSLSIPKKTDREIMVKMTIPADASTTELTNSMLFFTQIGKQEDKPKREMGIGIIPLFEFGLHIYHTPPGNSTRSLDIEGIENTFNEANQIQLVKVRLYNDGNVVNDASAELELTNTTTGEDIKLDPINLSMMPKTYQTVIFQLPKNLQGTYLGVSIIKMAGTNDLRVGEKTFEF